MNKKKHFGDPDGNWTRGISLAGAIFTTELSSISYSLPA